MIYQSKSNKSKNPGPATPEILDATDAIKVHYSALILRLKQSSGPQKIEFSHISCFTFLFYPCKNFLVVPMQERISCQVGKRHRTGCRPPVRTLHYRRLCSHVVVWPGILFPFVLLNLLRSPAFKIFNAQAQSVDLKCDRWQWLEIVILCSSWSDSLKRFGESVWIMFGNFHAFNWFLMWNELKRAGQRWHLNTLKKHFARLYSKVGAESAQLNCCSDTKSSLSNSAVPRKILPCILFVEFVVMFWLAGSSGQQKFN